MPTTDKQTKRKKKRAGDHEYLSINIYIKTRFSQKNISKKFIMKLRSCRAIWEGDGLIQSFFNHPAEFLHYWTVIHHYNMNTGKICQLLGSNSWYLDKTWNTTEEKEIIFWQVLPYCLWIIILHHGRSSMKELALHAS